MGKQCIDDQSLAVYLSPFRYDLIETTDGGNGENATLLNAAQPKPFTGLRCLQLLGLTQTKICKNGVRRSWASPAYILKPRRHTGSESARRGEEGKTPLQLQMESPSYRQNLFGVSSDMSCSLSLSISISRSLSPPLCLSVCLSVCLSLSLSLSFSPWHSEPCVAWCSFTSVAPMCVQSATNVGRPSRSPGGAVCLLCMGPAPGGGQWQIV